VLSSAVGTAVKTKKLTFNPVEHVELPRIKGRHAKPLVWTTERVDRWLETGQTPSPVMVWTPRQVGAFLDFAAEERLYALFHVVAFRGAAPRRDRRTPLGRHRPRRLPHPDRTRDPARRRGRLRRHQIRSGRTRTIGLDQGTIKVVSAWRTRQKAEKLAAGPSWIDLGRVFTREDGSALRPGWISLRFDASIKQYNAIRRRHFDDEWPIERIARQHRINEDKARIAIERP
jgi:hypothetical protein